MSFEIIDDGRDRARWLALRREGIGSSDAPAVLGVSPWSVPLKVYADKLGEVEDSEESEAMRWGRILEPHIIAEFAREMGRKAARQGALLRSTRWPWMQATLDATQRRDGRDDTGVLEVKATGFRAGDWREGIPEHVRVQVQHQLAVTGFEWGSVAVLIGGARLLYADVTRDAALIEQVVQAEHDLWLRIQRHEPPDPDGSESAREALRALYPQDNGESVSLPGELIELDRERAEIVEDLKRLDARKEAIDQQFKAAIGGATFGLLANGVTYSHRLQKREGYIVKPAEFRVLRRSKK